VSIILFAQPLCPLSSAPLAPWAARAAAPRARVCVPARVRGLQAGLRSRAPRASGCRAAAASGVWTSLGMNNTWNGLEDSLFSQNVNA